ncbi:hypothetical protein BC936DRAFT_137948 [Jimgerdemannia flammicorona]|uniref:Heparan-alpha-glucosaminide N-acetyltransferase catalytic domain-containing protein n=1 Tax=Jimgerdemannia flammicorona TaxID=994334 RepID=A0A433CWC2_9FUNG|nr:hypothetical protein BC936DRAFT_137948 [Jimgerdemannia flammicorona]
MHPSTSHTPPNDPTDPINHDDPESQPIDPLLSFTKPARLTSVDLLRGLTVFSMILVNTSNPGSFSFLQHTAWTGMTFADTIFPTFLFIVGVSIPLALNPERHLSGLDMRSWRTKTTRRILVRGLKLWCIGFVLLNLVPYIGMRWFVSPEEAFLRIPGVLQRIAVCYVVVALVHVQVLGREDGAVEEMRGISRQIWCASMIVFPSGLLVVYLILTYTLTGCTERDSFLDPPECSAEAYLDTIVFTRSHNYNLGAFDPEGMNPVHVHETIPPHTHTHTRNYPPHFQAPSPPSLQF